jgi:hypothetical protein
MDAVIHLTILCPTAEFHGRKNESWCFVKVVFALTGR